jgi:hypothetical protein
MLVILSDFNAHLGKETIEVNAHYIKKQIKKGILLYQFITVNGLILLSIQFLQGYIKELGLNLIT